LADVIQKAKDVLEEDSYSLKTAAHQDPELDDSNPFFVDGLGTLCDLDPDTRTRVSDLFSGSPKYAIFLLALYCPASRSESYSILRDPERPDSWSKASANHGDSILRQI
jgi:hypothetical protein